MIRSTTPPDALAAPARAGARAAPRAGRVLLALWLGYLLFAPTLGFGWIDSWHNEQRLAQVLLLGLGAVVLALALSDPALRRGLPPLPHAVPIVFLLGTISALRATYLTEAVAELSLNLLLLALIWIAAGVYAAQPQKSYRLLRWAAVLLLAVYMAGVVVRYAAALSIAQPLGLDVLLLGYANPRFPSALHALLLPLAADLVLDARPPRWLRGAVAGLMVLTWAVNLALGTRAIWFAFALTLVLLWPVLGRRRLGPYAACLAGTAVAGALLYWLAFKEVPIWTGIGETFTQRTLDKLTWGSNRELLLRSSWEAIRAAPWLGLGPMQFAAIPGVWAAHPHNWVLQLASELGLPAAAAALLAIARWLGGHLARLRAAGAAADPDGLTLVLASVVALAYGLVDGNLVMPVSQSAAALVFGALLGHGGLPAPAAGAPAAPLRTLLGRLAVVILLAGAAAQLAWFALDTVDDATAQELPQRIFPSRTLWPRFWSDGFLPLRHAGEALAPATGPHAPGAPGQ
jgi:O-antigen ligase